MAAGCGRFPTGLGILSLKILMFALLSKIKIFEQK
jgi:hypothetical protein